MCSQKNVEDHFALLLFKALPKPELTLCLEVEINMRLIAFNDKKVRFVIKAFLYPITVPEVSVHYKTQGKLIYDLPQLDLIANSYGKYTVVCVGYITRSDI